MIGLASRWNLIFFALLLLTLSAFAATTVIVNSQDYPDILSGAIYAKAFDYNFVFALTPNQSIFISRYYTLSKNDSLVYLEGSRPILPNMAALLRESGLINLTIVQPASVSGWVADQMPHEEAIVVGSQYGQDALSVAPYAALTKSPVYFVDDSSQAGSLLATIASKNYKSVLFYGPIAHQIPAAELASIPNRRTMDTGSRYSNNLAIVREFMAKNPTGQIMFVSGRTFEKSMVDTKFPIILVGRSDVNADIPAFLRDVHIVSGVVFSGDADIVDGVTKLRAQVPTLALFVKFGEGYLGSNQPLPLMVIPLPSPQISLEVLNLTYNVPEKRFEIRVANHGDFVALTAGVSVSGAGAAESSQILMNPGSTTTLPVPLDATRVLSSSSRVPAADVTIRYGEDLKLLDNIDTISFTDVPSTAYSDNSSVSLVSIEYSSEQKAFIVTLDGQGYAEGTLQFSINDQPVTLFFPATVVSGRTTVVIKRLLSGDEEKFINNIPVNYFLRTGARNDILLRENRGQATMTVSAPLINGGGNGTGGGGLPILPICALGALAALAAGVYYFFMRQSGGGGFD